MTNITETKVTVYKVNSTSFYSESAAKRHIMIEDTKLALKTLIDDCTCEDITDQYEEKLDTSSTRSLDGQVVSVSRTRSQLHSCKCCGRKVEVAKDGSRLIYDVI